ncbi:protein ABHD11 isoform X2 [Falco biarmicus]|uniref:protein ABHD11 isoform X2 n=1 Tax=Falco rusticolus TaxID=120794 RepID=UPI00188688A3|nr:protein ABHD11 isoform X2 [Falco rusticolus]XP_055568852.1 protein ABHD11 isoform X2 [Falco cherrug]XP_056185555.1 protein ABHD11 isoform X2 [Falco biarmicus]
MLRWLPRARVPAPPPAAAARSLVTAVPLAYVEMGGRGDRLPLVLLHGLFGSASNLQSVAKALACRGSRKPDLVERLISVDISPVLTSHISEFSAYISAMKSVKIPDGLARSAARQLADNQLREVVQLPQLRQYLLTNLLEVEGRYVWRVNLEAISHHLADIINFPIFHKPYPGPALFLRGSNSPYISSKHYPEIQRLFPKADIQDIEGAGHIVHQDKFEELVTAVLNFLPPL